MRAFIRDIATGRVTVNRKGKKRDKERLRGQKMEDVGPGGGGGVEDRTCSPG